MDKDEKLPHCVLSPLEKFDPGILCDLQSADASGDGIILSLALAFNDLKDLEWAYWLLKEVQLEEPKDPKSAALWGHRNGVMGHINRLRVSLIVEVLELIRRNMKAVNSPLVKNAARKMGKNRGRAWDDIVRVATGERATEEHKDFCNFLVKVRANGTYHYYNIKGLAKGFNQHFKKGQKNTFLEKWAFLSRGNNFESTRFYFADAAALAVFHERPGNTSGDWNQAIEGYLTLINQTLRFLVSEYLKLRGAVLRKVKDEDFNGDA